MERDGPAEETEAGVRMGDLRERDDEDEDEEEMLI